MAGGSNRSVRPTKSIIVPPLHLSITSWETSICFTDESKTGWPASIGRKPGHIVFVRPHALEITRHPNGANHFRATTKHIHAAGPFVKVEAVTEWGAAVHVEMAQERFRDLALRKDEEVFITARDLAVFSKE